MVPLNGGHGQPPLYDAIPTLDDRATMAPPSTSTTPSTTTPSTTSASTKQELSSNAPLKKAPAAARIPRPHPERPSPLKHLAMRRGSNGDMQQFLRRRSSASSAHRSAMALALANLEAQHAGVKALPDHYRKRARAQYSKSRKQLLVASITSSVLARLEMARQKAELQAAQAQVQAQALSTTSGSAANDKPLPPTPPGPPRGQPTWPTNTLPEQGEGAADSAEPESDSEYTDVSSDSASTTSTASTASSAWYSPTASDTEDSEDDLSDTDADSDTQSARAIRTLRTNKDYDPTRPVMTVSSSTTDASVSTLKAPSPPAVAQQPAANRTAADMLVTGLQHHPPPAAAQVQVQAYATAAAAEPSTGGHLPPPPHRRSSLVATLSRRISLAPYQPLNPIPANGASPSTFLAPAPLPEHPEPVLPTVPAAVMSHPVPVLPLHPAATTTTTVPAASLPAGPESRPSSSPNLSPSPSSSSLNTHPASERQVRAAALKSILSRRTSNPVPPTQPFPTFSLAVGPVAGVAALGLIADPPIVRSHPPSATVAPSAAAAAAPPGSLVFPSPPPLARTTRSPSLPHLFARGGAPHRSHTLPHGAEAALHEHAGDFPATRSRSMSIPTCLLAGRRKKPPPPPLNLEGLTESFTRDMGKVKQIVRSKSLAELEEDRASKGFPRVSEAPEAFRKPGDEQAPEAAEQEGRAAERRPSLVKTIHVRPQKGLVASPESFVDESSAAEDGAGPIAPSAGELGRIHGSQREEDVQSTATSATSHASSTVPLPVSLSRPVPAAVATTLAAPAPSLAAAAAKAATFPRSLHVSASTSDLHQAAAAAGGIQATLSPRAFHFSGALQVLNDPKTAWLKRHFAFDGRTLTCLAHRTAPHLPAVAARGHSAEWTLDVSKIVLLALVSKRPPAAAAPSPPTAGADAWKLAFTISTAHADHVLRAGSQAELSNWMFVLGRAREMVQLQQTVANLMATVREQQGRELLGGSSSTVAGQQPMEDRGVKRPTTDPPTGRGMLSPVRVHCAPATPAVVSVAVKSVASSLNRPPPIVTSTSPAPLPAVPAHVAPLRQSMVASIVSTTASPESDFSFRSPLSSTAGAAGTADLGPRPVPVQLPGGAPQSAHLDLLVAELSRAVDALDPPSPPTGSPEVPAEASSPTDSDKHVATASRALAQVEAMVGQVSGLHAFVSATRSSWDAAAACSSLREEGGTSMWVADGHTARVRALARMVSDWPRVIVGASPEKKAVPPPAAPAVKFAASGVVTDSAVSVGTMVDAAQ